MCRASWFLIRSLSSLFSLLFLLRLPWLLFLQATCLFSFPSGYQTRVGSFHVFFLISFNPNDLREIQTIITRNRLCRHTWTPVCAHVNDIRLRKTSHKPCFFLLRRLPRKIHSSVFIPEHNVLADFILTLLFARLCYDILKPYSDLLLLEEAQEEELSHQLE